MAHTFDEPAGRPTSPTVGAGSSTSLRDTLLVALTVASGAADAISYFGLGKIFSAFMSGNIVFLGFGIAKIGDPDVTAVVFALWLFYALIYRWPSTRLTDKGVDDALTRFAWPGYRWMQKKLGRDVGASPRVRREALR